METFLLFVTAHYILVGTWVVLFFATLGLARLKQADQAILISSTEAIHRVNREAALMVDLRSATAYRQRHIAGAVNIPLDRLNKDRLRSQQKVPDVPIILVDERGIEAQKAAILLRQWGFTFTVLKVGIVGWNAEHLPLVKGSSNGTS